MVKSGQIWLLGHSRSRNQAAQLEAQPGHVWKTRERSRTLAPGGELLLYLRCPFCTQHPRSYELRCGLDTEVASGFRGSYSPPQSPQSPASLY